MKKFIFSISIALLSCLPATAQQRQSQAKLILDRAAEAFRQAGGVEASFTVRAMRDGAVEGEDTGVIQLKGEKFLLKTTGVTTWFDGTTQWSYVTANDEVNVSTPTKAELQQLNPYTLLYMYREGFDYQPGAEKNFGGKMATEVILTATDPKQEWERVTLYVEKGTYQPLFIELRQRGQDVVSQVTITDYQTKRRFADKLFAFDRKQYPQAEIIDLR
ncbi:MAG: hypothetical protein LBN29_11130 [Mediterranea sp.]|jgi:outer membrane lipoprotein-sorting protein|nr:hypothetical protein [Mediterranea sp.]